MNKVIKLMYLKLLSNESCLPANIKKYLIDGEKIINKIEKDLYKKNHSKIEGTINFSLPNTISR